jgi:hypothetical protein
MVRIDMRLTQKLRIAIALLLAWVLPLQGAAAMHGCARAESQILSLQQTPAAGLASPEAPQLDRLDRRPPRDL